jgi:hypothetical protein
MRWLFKSQLQNVWLYVVVGLPLTLLILKHGWGESVRDGDMFLLASGVLAAVLAERVKEVSEAQQYKPRETGIALAKLLPGLALSTLLLGLCIFFWVDATPDGKLGWGQIVWFWVAVLWAFLIRFPDFVEPEPEPDQAAGEPTAT